jgi:hypothetical protein
MSIKGNVLYYDFNYISYTLTFNLIVLAGYMLKKKICGSGDMTQVVRPWVQTSVPPKSKKKKWKTLEYYSKYYSQTQVPVQIQLYFLELIVYIFEILLRDWGNDKKLKS